MQPLAQLRVLDLSHTFAYDTKDLISLPNLFPRLQSLTLGRKCKCLFACAHLKCSIEFSGDTVSAPAQNHTFAYDTKVRVHILLTFQFT